MTTRVPIERDGIRKGDLIRAEVKDGAIPPGALINAEYVADEDRDNAGADILGVPCDLFLLDRPEPEPVPLDFIPSTPTLGWVTLAIDDSRVLGMWERYEYDGVLGDEPTRVSALVREHDLVPDQVADFQEAEAVPKAALDALVLACTNGEGVMVYSAAVRDFLGVVEATRAAGAKR